MRPEFEVMGHRITALIEGGNYDPSADSYWIEFVCPDCHKKWIEEQ